MKKKIYNYAMRFMAILLIFTMLPIPAVNVNAVEKPNLTNKKINVAIGETAEIKVKNVPKGAKVTYKTNNSNIVKVYSEGKIKGIKTGNAEVIVSIKKKSKTYTLACRVFVRKPKLLKNKITLSPKGKTKLQIKNKPVKAKCIWKSSNRRVAKVSNKGEITAKAKGKAVIKARVKTSDKTYVLKCKVVVRKGGFIDDDNDNVPDSVEKLLGISSKEKDSDNDGLSDYVEIYESDTDPTLADTDGDGVLDGNEDSDGDGLTNLKEVSLGTGILQVDSDQDGINDYEEVSKYLTDPLNPDTDKDGVSDGWEINNGYDPKKYDETFKVEKRVKNYKTSVSVSMESSGKNAESLEITEFSNEALLDDTIPGYLGSAYELNYDGVYNDATISFEFDSSLLEDSKFQPVIYSFDKTKQSLEEIKTDVNGNFASAAVDRSSTYTLINKNEYDSAWETGIRHPMDINDQKKDAVSDIVFVIDYSNSMSDNDPNQTFKDLSKEFVSKLRDEVDQAAIIKFVADATLVSSLTSNKYEIYSEIDAIEYDSGYNSNSGTNGSAGIKMGLDELESSNADFKYMVFITDGEDNRSSYSYSDLIERAKSLGIVIYTIGMGSASKNILKDIAKSTGGTYYSATTKDNTAEDNIFDLKDVYDKIQSGTIDFTLDSNDDGISDYYTQLLCDGTLKLGTGKNNPFYGKSYDIIQSNSDYDEDGKRNGSELMVYYDEPTNRVYVQMNSDPTLPDSDFDGIDDKDDENCLDNTFGGVHYNWVKEGINVNFKVDYRDLITDTSTYKPEVSVLGCLFASMAYSTREPKVKINIKDGAKINGNIMDMYRGLGLQNVETIKLDEKYDDDDISDIILGHRLVVLQDGKNTEVIVASIRGTGGNVKEWSSNFDVGADTDDYWDRYNALWDKKEDHKGFYVTAMRLYDEIDKYIKDPENKFDSNAGKAIFLNGHSRGAAIANILGAKFEDRSDFISCSYGFATPNTTTDSDASSYKTVFSIVNKDDLVPYLPLTDWGFKKYGIVKSVSVKDTYEHTMADGIERSQESWERLMNENRLIKNVDYNFNGNKENTLKEFGKIVGKGSEARAKLYQFPGENDTCLIGDIYLSKKQTLKAIKKLKGEYGMRMNRFCSIDSKKLKVGVGYVIRVKQTPAFFMMAIADLAGNGSHKDNIGQDLILGQPLGFEVAKAYNKAKYSFVWSALDTKAIANVLRIGGMVDGHKPETYYLISKYSFYGFEIASGDGGGESW